MKIYVASSWRCSNQPGVVQLLRSEGYEVYDFRNPEEGDNGFHWSQIDKGWKSWPPEEYRVHLKHPLAERGFKTDFAALNWADICVAVQPFGRSASLELGWFAGRGKPTCLLLANGEPELMVKMCDHILCSTDELLVALANEEKLLGSRMNSE